MEYLTTRIKKDIARHATQDIPNECCGLNYSTDTAFYSSTCENVAENKKINFRISPKNYLEVSKLGNIRAYYHSHVEDEVGVFSDADKKVSKGHELPLIMYCIKKEQFLEYT